MKKTCLDWWSSGTYRERRVATAPIKFLHSTGVLFPDRQISIGWQKWKYRDDLLTEGNRLITSRIRRITRKVLRRDHGSSRGYQSAREHHSRPIIMTLHDLGRNMVAVQEPLAGPVGTERNRPSDLTDNGPGSGEMRLRHTGCFLPVGVTRCLACARKLRGRSTNAGLVSHTSVLLAENDTPGFPFVTSVALGGLRARGRRRPSTELPQAIGEVTLLYPSAHLLNRTGAEPRDPPVSR